MALNNSNSTASTANPNTNNNNNNNNNHNSNESLTGAGTVATNKNDNLVVRIDENSDDNLQALFDSVLKPGDSKRPLIVPFRMRKLPDSFFNPPSTGSKSPSVSHSRENSTDSAFGSGTTTICSPNGNAKINNGNANQTIAGATAINAIPNRLQISHSRAHSSPASLQQTYAGLTNQANNAVVASQAANSVLAQQQQQQQAQQQTAAQIRSQAANQPVHARQRSYDVISSIQLRDELGDLPPGWEQTTTPDGTVYYIE